MGEAKKERRVPKSARPSENARRQAAAEEPAPGKGIFHAGTALSFFVSIAVYVRTMAASVSFWDSGEFIATSYILGIPHSPGTPLYVLVGRVFSMLPIPASIPVKINFLSALFGAMGAMFVYLLVVRFLDHVVGKSKSSLDTLIKVAAGLVGAFFITFSDTYWVNATEAEVYAMSCFLMGFMTWLGLRWEENPRHPKATYLMLLLFYLLSLSVGFHLGTILAFSGIFCVVLMTRDKPFTNLEFIVACLGVAIFVADATMYRNGRLTLFFLVLFSLLLIYLYARGSRFALFTTALIILGISVHLFMLIRSAQNPAIDEGNPETWRMLYAALRREQYPAMNVFHRKASFLFQLEHFNKYFQSQFEMAHLYLGRLNLGSLLPTALGLWGIVDQWSRDRKTFVMLFVTFVVTSLGLVVFLNFSDHEVRERDYFYSPAFYYFAVFIGIGAGSLLHSLKSTLRESTPASRFAVYGAAFILLLMPWATFKLHFFTHDRSSNYVCHDYAVNMLKPLEKDAIVFTNGDNDTFPLWYIQEVENFRKDVRVVNLSLLNTPWYITQLRDNEPRLPISWSSAQIERLQPIPTKEGWILVRDLAVQHILKENRWKRPIYFAVTIPPETFAPYREYLEMQGLVYKLVPRKGQNMIDKEKLEENVFNVFSYRSILTDDWRRDDSLYLVPHIRHLIQNYAAAFCQLAFIKRTEGKLDEAIRALEVAKEISPDIDPVVILLGWYYMEKGDYDKAIREYKEQVSRHPDNPEILYRLAGVYERSGDGPSALLVLEKLISIRPDDRDAVLSAAGLAAKLNLAHRARSYLSNYLASHSGDEEIRKTLGELDRAIKDSEQQE